LFVFAKSSYGTLLIINKFFLAEKKTKNMISLLENMLFTSVVYDFPHRFLTDVESTNVESIIVNISFKKLMLT